MNLMAATITIYFFGLTNFDTTSGYTALVPLATGSPSVSSVTLEPHRTDLVITKWPSGGTPCTSLPGGNWYSAYNTCIVRGLQHREIEIVSSEALTVQPEFKSIPQLKKTLCPPLGDLNSNAGTAVKMAISNGTLSACLNGQAWVTSLTVDVDASNNFKIGPAGGSKKIVSLPGGAVVNIITVPTSTTHGTEEAHFFWYYYMRNDHTSCGVLPTELDSVPEHLKCPPDITPFDPQSGGFYNVATGVGCSVTQYP